MIAVAVDEFGGVKRRWRAVVVGDDAADADDVVLAIVVDIGDAELMTFGIVLAVRCLVKPALGQRAVAIIPRDGETLKRAAAHAVFAAEQNARMNAVEINDASVTIQRAVSEVGIGNDGSGFLRAGHAVEDGKELNRVVVRYDC